MKDADGMANSIDPQSDLGLHCFLRSVVENLESLQYEPRHEKICLWGL